MKLVLFLSLQAATALLLPAARLRPAPAQASSRQAQMSLDRRSALGVFAALPAAFLSTTPAVAATDKVVIFGGSGYVGAHAAQMLLGQGAQVVSVSRKSPAEQVAPTRTRTKRMRTLCILPLRSCDGGRVPLSPLLCASSRLRPRALAVAISRTPTLAAAAGAGTPVPLACRCRYPCTPRLPLPVPLYP